MYSAERRREILRLIAKTEGVNVGELAAQFDVSRATVRRDLNELHRLGLLERTYGGALAPDGLGSGPGKLGEEASFDERKAAHRDEKERIGRYAASLVQPGETIFIDGGTTTEFMLSYLAGKAGLTVVTFGLNILNRLLPFDNVTVIIIGGMLNRASLTLSGTLALDSMQTYRVRFDKAFLAAGGVSARAGITNYSLEQVPYKRQAAEAACTSVLLADSSKVGAVATGLIIPAGNIDRIVTGAPAPAGEVAALRELGVTVDLV
jgi:DeoR/GlpR family transcriptional regulator of sugar metabolism